MATPVTQQYYNFKDFPLISPTELYAMSSEGQAAISSYTAFAVEKLFSALPPIGEVTSTIVKSLVGNTISEAQVKTVEVIVNDEGKVSIAGSAFSKSGAARRVGSIPTRGTKLKNKVMVI